MWAVCWWCRGRSWCRFGSIWVDPRSTHCRSSVERIDLGRFGVDLVLFGSDWGAPGSLLEDELLKAFVRRNSVQTRVLASNAYKDICCKSYVTTNPHEKRQGRSREGGRQEETEEAVCRMSFGHRRCAQKSVGTCFASNISVTNCDKMSYNIVQGRLSFGGNVSVQSTNSIVGHVFLTCFGHVVSLASPGALGATTRSFPTVRHVFWTHLGPPTPLAASLGVEGGSGGGARDMCT